MNEALMYARHVASATPQRELAPADLPRWRRVLDFAAKAIGIPAAGFVIGYGMAAL